MFFFKKTHGSFSFVPPFSTAGWLSGEPAKEELFGEEAWPGAQVVGVTRWEEGRTAHGTLWVSMVFRRFLL